MFQKTLLATTALVLCALGAHAGQNGIIPKSHAALAKMLSRAAHVLSGAPAIVINTGRDSRPVQNIAPNLENAIFSNYNHDANAQFISWYGYRVENSVTCYGGCSYNSTVHVTADNAFGFTPAASVTTKKVTVAVWSLYSPSAEYQVDIYSGVGGLPGSVIARSKPFTASDVSVCCTSSRTVAIKANLVAGKQYFIGVVGTLDGGGIAFGGWMMEDTDFSGAAVDYFHFRESISYYDTQHHTYQTYTYSSPWHASLYLPVTGAAVLK